MPKRRALSPTNVRPRKKFPRLDIDSGSSSASESSDSDSDENAQNTSYRLFKPTFPLEQSCGNVQKVKCENQLHPPVACVSKDANDSNCPSHSSTVDVECQKQPFAEAISEPAFRQNVPIECGSDDNEISNFPADKTASLPMLDFTAVGSVTFVSEENIKCGPLSLETVEESNPFLTKETAGNEMSLKSSACTSPAVCEPDNIVKVEVPSDILENEDNYSALKSSTESQSEVTLKEVQKEEDELQIVIVEDTNLEEKLEVDAQQHNLTATNVKNILHEVITNEHVIAMMRAALNDAAEAPVFEPKMTRSKAKEVSEKGSVPVLWSSPNSKDAFKTKQPQFLEIPLEEEDSSDEEYQPEEEEDDTAEESLLESDLENSLVVECVSPISPGHHWLRRSSGVSDVEDEGAADAQSVPVEEPQPTVQKIRHISAMVVPMGPPPPLPAKDSTFIEKLNAVDEELAFSSIVGYQYRTDDENLIAYRTRSKRTLRDMPIGQLEAELNAPDTTPDMYEPAVTEDEDWKSWLHGLMTDPVDNAEDNDDEEDDPEYNFLEDPDEPDVEDFRNDRSVRISKKEVNELMEELFETFGDEGGSQEWEEEVEEEAEQHEADFNTPQTIRFEEHLANSIKDCQHTVKTQLDLLKMRKSNVKKKQPHSPERKEEEEQEKKEGCSFSFTPEQHTMLQQQMQQHVQLLTQVNVMCTGNPNLSQDADLCRTFLQELNNMGEVAQKKYVHGNSTFSSHFISCNLKEALHIVDDIEKNEKAKSNTKSSKIESSEKRSVRGRNPTCSVKLACIIMKSQVFMYRELLPSCMLHPPKPKEKDIFTNGEDNLLVLGLKNFEQIPCQKTLISQYLMPPKTMQQISIRIKNLLAKRSSNNVVKMYKKTGIVPPMPKPCEDVLPEEAVAPINRDPRELPQGLRKCICAVKAQLNKKELVTSQSPPTVLPDVKVQINENETTMPQSPANVTVTEEDPQLTKENEHVEESKSSQDEILQSCMQTDAVMENYQLGCVSIAGDERDVKVNEIDKKRLDCEGEAHVDEQEEEELTQEEEEDEDDSTSESGDSALSVPELQETIDKLSWLASDTRANNPGGDSEDDIISQEETSEQDEEEEEITEPPNSEQENKWNPVVPGFSSSVPAPVDESVTSSVELKGQQEVAPKEKVAIKVKPKRTRYRASMDTAKMLLLLSDDILETDPQRDKKDLIYAQAYLNRVKETLKAAPGKYEEFLKILHNFEMNLTHRSVVDMYEELHNALIEWPELLKEFAVFLFPDQALECGLFEEQQDFEKSRTFLRQLEICFGENPYYYQKVVKALQSCVKFTQEDMNEMKTQMWHLMKGHNYLQDVFSMFFDHLRPPTSRMDDFEEVNWTDEKIYKFDGFEDVVLPKLKKYNKRRNKNKGDSSSCEKDDISAAGIKPCTCTCHEVTNTELRPMKCKKKCLLCVNKISGEVKIVKRKEVEHLSQLTEQDPPAQVTESLSHLKKTEKINNIDGDEKKSGISQTNKNTDSAQTNEANVNNPVSECQSIAQSGPTVDSPTKDPKSTPTSVHSSEKSTRIAIEDKSADEQTSKNQSESSNELTQIGCQGETTTGCAPENVSSLVRTVKAKEHGNGTLQSGNAKHQAEPSERLHVVCAKNSTVSSTGELVVLWTREADKIILTTCQEKGANGATFAEIAKLLGNKTPQEVSRRFRELVRLFHTAAAAVSPCRHSDEEEEEDSTSNSLEPLSDRDSVATDDEIS